VSAGRIGIIADTHGLLRPEAKQALSGCALIVHAGDVGRPEVIEELANLAPLHVVRGNVDRGHWAEQLSETCAVDYSGIRFYVIHDIAEMRLNPAAAGYQAVISGHSHQPRITRDHGVLYINPGSAGPRRFKLPVAVAVAWLEGGRLSAAIHQLQV